MWATSPCVCSRGCSGCTPQIQTIAITIVCPPELDSKTVLLKTPSTIVRACGEIELVLTRTFSLYYLAILVLERAAQASVGEKSSSFYSDTDLQRYPVWQDMALGARVTQMFWGWLNMFKTAFKVLPQEETNAWNCKHRQESMVGELAVPKVEYTTILLIIGHSIILTSSLYHSSERFLSLVVGG